MRFRRTKVGTGPERLAMLVLLTAWMAVLGCSSGARDKAGESDANGYFCLECGAKFYTDRKIFAERCPSCQTLRIKQLNGFVCEKDSHMIIAPGGRDAVKCDQCGQPTTALRLPHEDELKAWGAEEKGRAEVLIQQ